MTDNMTIPTMMNCPHTDKGWCLTCVQKLHAQNGITHKQGCPATGGYGHGVENCICGETTPSVPTPDWPAAQRALIAYVEAYEMEGDDGFYIPTDNDKYMLMDCIHGLFVDEDFCKALGIYSITAAPIPNDTRTVPHIAEGKLALAVTPTPKTDAYFDVYNSWMDYSKKHPNMSLEQYEQCPIDQSPEEFCAELEAKLVAAQQTENRLREGLKWYANGNHYVFEPEWEEEEGWLCPPTEDSYMVEPGHVAQAILNGQEINSNAGEDDCLTRDVIEDEGRS